mmetsp:Transcript_9292/g.23863  ORF Transcript_9292/g.23863 Transcript_9292/m.23863 type:complete len:334 (+) Transcript_9292:635-1636(+)
MPTPTPMSPCFFVCVPVLCDIEHRRVPTGNPWPLLLLEDTDLGGPDDAPVKFEPSLGDNGDTSRRFAVLRGNLELRLVQVGVERVACGVVTLQTIPFEGLEHLLLRHLDPFVQRLEQLERFGLRLLVRFLQVLGFHDGEGPFHVVRNIKQTFHEPLDRELAGVLHLPGSPFPQVFHVRQRPKHVVLESFVLFLLAGERSLQVFHLLGKLRTLRRCIVAARHPTGVCITPIGISARFLVGLLARGSVLLFVAALRKQKPPPSRRGPDPGTPKPHWHCTLHPTPSPVMGGSEEGLPRAIAPGSPRGGVLRESREPPQLRCGRITTTTTSGGGDRR